MRQTAWLLCVALLAGYAMSQEVSNTPHNLSASGPGPVKAQSESEICVFCHTPHSAAPQTPLWNRRDPGGTYATYTSSTLKVAPGQPSGATRLCLSCHDGTIALGEVLSRSQEVAMTGSSTMPAGRSRIGVDLSDDHPVSTDYAAAAAALGVELRSNPSDGERSLLDEGGDVQCTSCHDPHDNSKGKFLRIVPRNGALCTACHTPSGWTGSTHSTSTRTWNGSGEDPWPRSDYTTVKENACGSCHTAHQAAGKSRLLTSDVEEEVCLACHSGNVATKNIATELAKYSAHDVSAQKGVHDPTETPDGKRTHVECTDCHNAHKTTGSGGGGGGLPGSLQGVSGLDTDGNAMTTATKEYQICYKCHSDDADSNPQRIPRIATQPNIRRRFDPQNPSFHPIEAVGKNPDVPSLKQGWTVTSIVKCTDCHNNDTGPGAGGAGPKGPHGSAWDWLLERRYETTTPTRESSTVYALCYKCHDRQSILGDDSFTHHRKHILGPRTSCSVCHDPHGIDSAQQGQAGDNTHLINFDTRVVFPNKDGKLEFIDQGLFRGSCSLKCHNKNHKDREYAPRN